MIQNKFYYGIDHLKGSGETKPEKRQRIMMARKLNRSFRKGYITALINEGYAYPEIAKKLNMSESSVRSIMQREREHSDSE